MHEIDDPRGIVRVLRRFREIDRVAAHQPARRKLLVDIVGRGLEVPQIHGVLAIRSLFVGNDVSRTDGLGLAK